MIPYFTQPSLELGPLTFHAFGALVVIAILVGSWMVQKRTVEQGLDPDKSYNLVTWMLISAFVVSHLFEVLVYHPEKLAEDPWALFKIWEGMSSFGGFMGAALGIILFNKRHLEGKDEVWRYVDCIAFAFPFGWIFGRTGCTIALDHPGIETDFFLGFQRSSGIVIHNLGFYEMIFTVFLAGFLWAIRNKHFYSGFWVGLLWTVYAPVRFTLDFFRTRDVKYLELTPGQWSAIAMLVISIAILIIRKRAGDTEPFTSGTTTPEETPDAQAAV